jgi:acyl carrier protein
MPKLQRIFLELFQVPPADLGPDMGPGQIAKWDSLGHMQLVTAIQKEFGITLTLDEVMQMDSVQNITSVLEKRGVAG